MTWSCLQNKGFKEDFLHQNVWFKFSFSDAYRDTIFTSFPLPFPELGDRKFSYIAMGATISSYVYLTKMSILFLNLFLYFSTDWVLKLGPVENDQYQYSVISDPIRLSLFVLARDPDDFKNRFEAEVLSFFVQ